MPTLIMSALGGKADVRRSGSIDPFMGTRPSSEENLGGHLNPDALAERRLGLGLMRPSTL